MSMRDFKKNIKTVIAERPDGPLPYKKNTVKAVRARNLRKDEWPDFQEKRADLSRKRIDDIEHLEELHEKLREKWAANGIIAHEAVDAQSARETVLNILQGHGINKILKSKSMLSEEIEINPFLEQHGIVPFETDLGEYIVQLRGEHPSHITMPAMHLTRVEIGQLFAEKLGIEYTEDPSELTQIARETLRKEFLSSEAGMCGVNFAVAETGHLATVTNEGNGRMVTSTPKVVIALLGWERVTKSLGNLSMLWQFLARSATGQKTTVYLNLTHGPAPGPVGPREVHVIIVDNGRKSLYADEELRPVLRCIRCGACLNTCPVYQQLGGHPYGGVYPGPIGKVLAPALYGLEEAPDHPFASSLCGACEAICPASIPLPELMLLLRKRITENIPGKASEQKIWSLFKYMMSDSNRYEQATALARTAQRFWPGRDFPVPGWSTGRTSPTLAPKAFRDLFENRKDGGADDE